MYGKYSIKHNLIFIDKLQEITSNYQSSMHQKLKGRSSKPSPKISIERLYYETQLELVQTY